MQKSHPWLERLHSFVQTGPKGLSQYKSLLSPNALDTRDIILPLVARRSLKRLLTSILKIKSNKEYIQEWHRLINYIIMFNDGVLEDFLTRPEISAMISKIEENPENAEWILPWFVQLIAGTAINFKMDLEPIRIAKTTSKSILLPNSLTEIEIEASSEENALIEIQSGRVRVIGESFLVKDAASFGNGIGISTSRDNWLLKSFPGVEHVETLTLDMKTSYINSLEKALIVLQEAWPEAFNELKILLHWVVPLQGRDSWYVPGMNGLIALGVDSGHRQVRDIFHETSHHKFSRILELVSAAANPEKEVHSPFSRTPGPITSLFQSCWAFSREHILINKLKDVGYIKREEILKEEIRFHVFFEKGIPILKKEAKLTEAGMSILESIEEAIK